MGQRRKNTLEMTLSILELKIANQVLPLWLVGRQGQNEERDLGVYGLGGTRQSKKMTACVPRKSESRWQWGISLINPSV